MEIITTEIPGLVLIKPKIFGDARGYFYESWNKERYESAGITEDFVQDNVSFSSRGVLRGLHYQKPYTQGKLVSVLVGEVWDVVVDLRRNSPTFGKWQGFTLTGERKEQVRLFAYVGVLQRPAVDGHAVFGLVAGAAPVHRARADDVDGAAVHQKRRVQLCGRTALGSKL